MNWTRIRMSQRCLNSLSILAIESELVGDLDFNDVVEGFLRRNARKKTIAVLTANKLPSIMLHRTLSVHTESVKYAPLLRHINKSRDNSFQLNESAVPRP